MKRLILLTAFSLFFLVGCVREQVDPSSVPQMTIRVSIPSSPVSKASFSVPGSGEGLHLAWQDGDAIRVIDYMDETNNEKYDIQPGFTDHVAFFSGPVISGSTFNIICPGTYTSIDDADAGDPSLTQSGNGSTSHLVFTAMLEGVSEADLSSIDFNQEWVSNHGCTLYRGGIVKLILTLPDEITAPKKVEMTLDDGVMIVMSRSLNITGVSLTSEHVLTAYLQSSWEDKDFTNITVKVTDADGTVYKASRSAVDPVTMMAGYQNIIVMPGSTGTAFVEEPFAGGDGTQANPYLLSSAKHLDNMHLDGVLKHGEKVYFRVIKDIDMESYLSTNRWIPLNSVNPYDYIIDFDGGNHIINKFTCTYDSTSDDNVTQKDPSFFGVLTGSCYDVSFTNANVTCNNGPCGILGGYVGYSGKKAIVYNVHLTGEVRRTHAGGNGTLGCGAMAGLINFAYIDSCSSDVYVYSTKDFTGGLVGRDDGDASRIRNCWTAGTVESQQKVGGIIGGIIRPETEVINCYSTATVNAMRFSGGIVGDACLDAGSNNHYKEAATLTPDNVVKGCIAWQTLLRTRDQAGVKDGWASGAIIGLTATHNYLIDCKRNPSFVLDDFSDELTLYDQANSDPSSALSITNPNAGTYKHYSPYHGQAATSTNLSTVAQNIGWSNVAWNFSGSVPVLTGVVQPEDPEDVPTSGDSNILDVATTARAFPTNGTTKNGLTWDVANVRSGIRYYHGYGTPTDTWWGDKYSTSAAGQYQEIFIVDLDLSFTDYDVKIVVSNPGAPTSTVFSNTGAIAAINGGYEKASIAVKGNMLLMGTDTNSDDVIDQWDCTNYPYGYPYSYMPNNTIGDTGVANWKSEGAFYSDGHQGVRIAFDAYNGGATEKTATGSTTLKSVKAMRKFYKQSTDNEAGFISSAPILDANYVRFGMTFYSRAASGTDGESPKVHQGSCYSRTAVGIAYPNGDSNAPHLLLICNDGKYTNGTHGYGMSAYQLERVIANFFGPKYLLNLDGGGSTTMCVEGQGDATTHVVNYPSDNYTGKIDTGKVDHAGERARDTFIVIVPAS